MTLAMLSTDEKRVRGCFRLMRNLRETLRDCAPDGMSFEGLSMGMSGDFEIAVEEGATLLRVGQAIFGTRALAHAHYWPETDGGGIMVSRDLILVHCAHTHEFGATARAPPHLL